jgi:hypothetical protein
MDNEITIDHPDHPDFLPSACIDLQGWLDHYRYMQAWTIEQGRLPNPAYEESIRYYEAALKEEAAQP